MNRFSKKQWMMFGLIVLAVIVASDWQDVNSVSRKSSTSVVQASVRGVDAASPRRGTEVFNVRLDKLGKRVTSDVKAINVFERKTWFVAPPPPPPPPPLKPVPPPPPTAPPLPYAFLGSYQEPGGKQIIFLTRGERVYSISLGEVLENTYRVDGVAAGQLSLTYLPLNIKQTMSIGESS